MDAASTALEEAPLLGGVSLLEAFHKAVSWCPEPGSTAIWEGEGDGRGDSVVTPNPVGFRLAEAERFGPSAGDQSSPSACGLSSSATV